LRFYSEYGEDQWIAEHWQALGLPNAGNYVDVGAADPVRASNTAFLRDRGWTGLAIDGNARWSPAWEGIGCDEAGVSTLFVCAVISPEKVVKFNANREMDSRIEEAGTLRPAQRLDTILRHSLLEGPIDFLSVDVEGQEFEVFQTFSLAERAPMVIVAEYNTSEIGEDYRLLNYLTRGGGYEVVHRTLANFVYRRVHGGPLAVPTNADQSGPPVV
jgi:hypothetical protein